MSTITRGWDWILVGCHSGKLSGGEIGCEHPRKLPWRMSGWLVCCCSVSALGATLMHAGEGKVDQTAQGVRFKGKFDTNLILFVGGAVRYVY